MSLDLILRIASEIQRVTVNVMANKSQCRLLDHRIQRISTLLKDFSVQLIQQQYQESLGYVKQIFSECSDFIASFSSSGWRKRVWNHRTYKGRFEELNKRLGEAIEELQLGIGLVEIFNPVEASKAEKEDGQAIQRMLPMLEKLQDGIDVLQVGVEDLHFGQNSMRGDVKQLLKMFHGMRFATEIPPATTAEMYYQQGCAKEKAGLNEIAAANYQLAVAMGHKKAKTNMSTFYREGIGGIAKDASRAYVMCFEAGSDGHARAMLNVATFMQYGIGTKMNLAGAEAWYQKTLRQPALPKGLQKMATENLSKVQKKRSARHQF